MTLLYQDARDLVDAARARALDLGKALSIAVVYDHVDGFAPATGAQPLADAAGIPPARRRTAPADPRADGRLAADEVAPVLATVDRPVFVALPAPGYLAAVGSPLAGTQELDAARAQGEALAALLRTEIEI